MHAAAECPFQNGQWVKRYYCESQGRHKAGWYYGQVVKIDCKTRQFKVHYSAEQAHAMFDFDSADLTSVEEDEVPVKQARSPA